MGLDMSIRDEETDNEVAYWRKFNALHNWFVKNIQDGVDECQKSRHLTKEDVEQILYILKAVDKAPLSAQALLPPTNGFFFGSTAYDDWFYQDVKKSIPMFQDILLRIEEGDKLYYQSSW